MPPPPPPQRPHAASPTPSSPRPPVPGSSPVGVVAPVAMVDGVRMALAEAVLPLTDDGVARGDGAFETVGVWDGRPFRLADHLARLAVSLDALALPPVDLDLLAGEVSALLDGVEADAALRVYVTGSGTRAVTLAPQPTRPDPVHLDLQPAPWIHPTERWPAGGAKSMSYAFNMAATRRARAAGADDALLHSVPDELVLEGPTFGVVVVLDGVVHAPSTDLGIVDSISRRTLLDLARAQGVEVRDARLPVEVLADAQEVVVSSAIRGAIAVRRVGRWSLPTPSPVAASLDRALDHRRRSASGLG